MLAAGQAADDDVEEGNNAVDDGHADRSDAVDDGHKDIADGLADALKLERVSGCSDRQNVFVLTQETTAPMMRVSQSNEILKNDCNGRCLVDYAV